MGIGLSGMVSGLDTDAIVQAMVSAQRTKSTKIENKITLNKWTTEAWSGLNTKIYSFYTKYASKLRLQSSFMTRTAKSSNESAVTATAGSTAAVGTHSLQIKSLASSQYVTGAQLMDKTNSTKKASYNKNTKLTEIGNDGVKEGTIITITGKKGTDDEVVKKLEVTDKTTVNDLLNACKDAGLTASFDETQQRFFISSSQSGADDAFSITTSELSGNASTVFNEINEAIKTEALSAEEKTKYNEAMATLRQNLDVIPNVLSDAYLESDKTQKAVYDAISVVKDAAAKTHEYDVATKAKEDATTEEDGKITELLTDAANGDTTAVLAYGNTTFTYDTLFEAAKTKVEEKIEAAAVKAGNEAVTGASIVKEDGKSYAELSDVTAEKYAEAQTTIADAKDVDGNAITVAEADIDTQLADGKISEETAKALKAAYSVVNTWEASVADEDGNATGTTISTLYTDTYMTSKTAADATKAEDIVAEMEAQLKAEQEETYNANIKTRTDELIAEADPTETEEVKTLIETNLLSAATAGVAASTSGLSALGLGDISFDEDGNVINTNSNMAVVAAADAKFVLDGAEMEETSNNFTVNGITLNLSATTERKDNSATTENEDNSATTENENKKQYDTVQITVGKDGDATYDLIKEALTEYNKLIEEMNKLYNADSAKGYDPLTDEQKEAMTEDDIKNWEDKIKGSLLRRDDSLGSLLNSMRSALSSTYTDEDDGKTYSLSTFGIVTGNYTEKGKLHIYGDEDDPTYATYNDRLKKALEDDPDQVMEVLTNVFGKLYDTMTEKCAKTEISSALTFYNDKQYKNLLDDYEDDLDIMEDRIKELEDRYYKQFTAMETALSKLQSQTNSLASLLGTGGQ